MADARDVIVTAFAQSGKTLRLADGSKINLKDFSEPLDIFTEKPIVLAVDATTQGDEVFYDKAFGRELERYRDQNGSILTRFLASHLAEVKVRRLGIIGFSAGGVFVKGILSSQDAAFIDSAIFLDAVHLGRPYAKAPPLAQAVAPLANFGVRAALAPDPWQGPLMIQAHTHIASPAPDSVTSTSESAAAITAVVKANAPGASRFGFNPDLFFEGPPPPAVTLGPETGLPPPAKTFSAIPDPAGTGIGNYYTLDFGGTVGADHAFIAWFVQRAIFKAFLGPRWNEGLDCKPSSAGALGQGFCGPGGVIVPEGVFQVPGGPNWQAALAGLVVGVGLGYVAVR
jgi:hypothetical protein